MGQLLGLSHWLWEDLGVYLRESNPGMSELSISALVVADVKIYRQQI